MEVENFVENKKIINWKFIALYNVLIGVLAVLSAYVVFQKYDKVGEYISNIKINNIIDIVTTFGMVAISIFPILIEKIDTRIVGISYKVIFFKNIRWKYMNYSNVTFILLETMVISIILECFPKTVYCQMITILLLITVIAGSWWIIYLTFVAVIKQSKIYYGLFNRIKKSNSLKDDAVEEIQKKMMRFSVKKIVGIKKIHQSYVFEEIGILLVIAIIKSEEKELDEFYKRIIVEVAFKIVSDDRENLFNNVCDLGDREFWEKRNTWESVKQDLKRTIEELKESIKQENVDNKKITR